MRPCARGYDCIRCIRLCWQHLSQRAPQTEHVVPSYGCSKFSEISAQTTLLTMISNNLEQSYLSATSSVWGALWLKCCLHDPTQLIQSCPRARGRILVVYWRRLGTPPCIPLAMYVLRTERAINTSEMHRAHAGAIPLVAPGHVDHD